MTSWSLLKRGTFREEKGTQPKLLGPDILRWGGGLPCEGEGVGAEKFGMPLEARETKLFWRDIPGFSRDIPEAPEKFEKKKFVLNSCPLFSLVHATSPQAVSSPKLWDFTTTPFC